MKFATYKQAKGAIHPDVFESETICPRCGARAGGKDRT